ncbi:MAG: RNA ligase RtcB family protein [Candidatus Sericytochromatia bacterium]
MTSECVFTPQLAPDGEPWQLIASSQSWIEGAAVAQLRQSARLPGMVQVWGLPDLHPGKGTPVGAAFLSQGMVYPHLVGNDIGCGMGLWQTELAAHKPKAERWQQQLQGLESAWDGDAADWLATWELDASLGTQGLGTIGGGNHFAELQRLQTVHDATTLAAAGLDPERLLLLVHSGSRGLGERILRAHVDTYQGQGLVADSPAAGAYLQAHNDAMRWAEANRALIAFRFLSQLRSDGSRRLDLCHNSVTPCSGGWLHRKGAAPADGGLAVIPGSRGSLSYLVEPVPSARSGWSLAHGAGRKWTRHDSKGRLERRYRPEDLRKTRLGSWVICEDRDLLYEEAPEAYKPIDRVVADLVEAGLVRVIAELAPLITYKMRRDT